MNTKMHCLTTVWFFLFFLLASGATYAQTAKVIGVSDGDKITVLQNKKQYKIRLYGIDCPESGQAFGKKAKKFTSSLVYGKNVELEAYDVDRYQRIVAVVYANGVNVNQSIIENGYAWQYTKYCKESFCNDWAGAEYQARKSRRGLWRDNSPMPPWEWRHSPQREQQVASNAAGKERQKRAYQQQRTVSAGGVVHGNVKSHKYHNPSCRYYNCKNCTRTFSSVAAARKAGYSACGICN